ncbi:MAG: hypothetical protein S4CHLAM37_11080 [Chlamydiia bacterium]|nr:hypothetical protein [Chlamydiia bacterium]
MIADLPPTELVKEITKEDQRKMVIDHFDLLYILLTESKVVPNATFEIVDGIKRGLSGIHFPLHNGLLGCPKKSRYDQCIDAQMNYFKKEEVPFVWYVDETEDPEFKKKLLDRGFIDLGVFQGLLGILDKSIPKADVPKSITLELVKDKTEMDEFMNVIDKVFDYGEENKIHFKKVMWESSQIPNGRAHHWVARKDGKVVSTLTTVVEGDIVSFWNGATLPEYRRQGLSTQLRRYALHDAITAGCHFGATYLQTGGMAYGICKKLGYQVKWNFHAFVAPSSEKS